MHRGVPAKQPNVSGDVTDLRRHAPAAFAYAFRALVQRAAGGGRRRRFT
jgi:hypothetical protein